MTVIPDAEAMMTALPVPVILIDDCNTIRRINTAAENIFKTSSSRVTGRQLADIFSSQDQRVSRLLADPRENISAREVKLTLFESRDLTCDFSLSSFSDGQWQVMIVNPLPTNSTAAAETSPQNAWHREATADILCHEIKNPLAAINGAAQLLGRKTDEAGAEMVQLIRNEVDRIVALLDKMQGLASVHVEKLSAENIHKLIKQARQRIETAHPQALTIEERFDPSLPPVQADPEATVQILSNLLANAADAVAQKVDPQIIIATRYSIGARFSADREDGPVRLPIEICVSDNGDGIPEEMKNDIFSPFFTTKRNGQGLGLAIVGKLVSDMHGQITHQRDASSKMTNFTIHLPQGPTVSS